jgi:hypothetical protein
MQPHAAFRLAVQQWPVECKPVKCKVLLALAAGELAGLLAVSHKSAWVKLLALQISVNKKLG